jgi:hypothetical protein
MVYIEKALRNQRDNIEPCNENLKEIIDLLRLTSTQELLKETIAVEKERLNAEGHKMKGDLEEINEIVNLVRNLRDYVMKTECFAVKSGVSSLHTFAVLYHWNSCWILLLWLPVKHTRGNLSKSGLIMG